MKRMLVVFCVVLAGAVVWLWWDGRDWQIANHPPDGTTVVAFGDSLVAGVGARESGGFVSRLSELVGVPIANLGRGGDTTAQGLDRLERVREHNPDIVLVLLGGNDAIRRISPERTFANLREIVTTLQSDGAVVVVLGVQGGLLGDPYDGAFKELARSTGAAYVSNVLEGVIGNAELMSDQIHPNDDGYAVIAQRVAEVVGPIVAAGKGRE